MPAYLLLALIASLAYSIGSIFNKQAMTEGCGVFRVFASMTWVTTAALIPFLFFAKEAAPWNLFYQPVLATLCWLAGASLWMSALRTGEVSLVAPVAGIKPVFNALLTALLLGAALSPAVWAACGLTALALLVMRAPDKKENGPFLKTIGLMAGAMLCYAFCDVCLQKWANGWGALRFLALMFCMASVLMLTLIPHFGRRYRDLTQTARRHLKTGMLIAAVPGFCMGLAIGRYGHAPEVNVMYSSQALWSVLLVWAFGRHIGNLEHTAGRHVMLRRLAGALILLIAIVLVISGSSL
jgi:drug/metabolite transporter (DMT)-like permease